MVVGALSPPAPMGDTENEGPTRTATTKTQFLEIRIKRKISKKQKRCACKLGEEMNSVPIIR
jgi:hypothetical protein